MKHIVRRRFIDMANINILRMPHSEQFSIAIEPKNVLFIFEIDSSAKMWADNNLTEFAQKMNLRNNERDLIRLRAHAISIFEDLYERGLCEFVDNTLKILAESEK